ncbi:MAG: ADP-ribosylglycohydrolase family protein [Spirulinaceae cyanobacterium]
MQHSLLSRFKGGLLGSYLGESLGRNYINNPLGEDWLKSQQENAAGWSGVSICALESLVNLGGLDNQNWLDQISLTEPSLLKSKNTASTAELAVATLPIALFFHEINSLQSKNLTEAAKLWGQESCDLLDISIWGYSLNLALKEKLNPINLIPQIISYCRGIETPLIKQLKEVEIFISQSVPLQQVTTYLCREGQKNNTPIALAFYCFLTTPEDFHIGVIRAVQTGYNPLLTAALTGALAGAYNSFNGIPCRWRSNVQKHQTSQKIALLATKLFAVWSGVEQPNNHQPLLNIAAVASPKILQSRSQLRIISQEE